MGKYDDIIYMPRHISKVHKPMSMQDRAAQFSSFQALVGYEEKIEETARTTEVKVELSEEEKIIINDKLSYLLAHNKEKIMVNISYFVQDSKKSGGKYHHTTTTIIKFNELEKKIHLATGEIINIDDILEINGEVFDNYDF